MCDLMKIITCVPLPPPYGGITNWYDVLCAEAERRKIEFLNVNVSPRKSIDGRSLLYRIFVQGFRMIGQRKELKRLIDRNSDAAAVHVATSGQLALVRDIWFLRLLKKKNVRSVYHLHFGTVPKIWERNGLQYRLFRKAINLASEVIAIDPKTYEILCGDLGEGKVHYIPNPVDVATEACEENSKRILFLGNILKIKGIEELLKAWKDLSEEYPEWKLTIAGFCEADYLEYLKKNYSVKSVEFCGSVVHNRAMELLAGSAFLVLPSYTEGFPNVILEAMMRQKAVIATDVGAVSDILSGECGLVIAPKSVEEIKNAVRYLINNPEHRRVLGQNGKNKASSQYVTAAVVDQYEEIWRGRN